MNESVGTNEYDTSQISDRGLDEDLKLFDFTHYPVPVTTKNEIRLFYNNVNGLEINTAIEAVVNNKRRQKQHEFVQNLEQYTKLEAFVKQMSQWEVDVSVLAEPCVEWRDTIPRKIVNEVSSKYDPQSNWTVATSTCYSGSFVKPGGAAIYSSSSVTGKIIARGTDPWGYG